MTPEEERIAALEEASGILTEQAMDLQSQLLEARLDTARLNKLEALGRKFVQEEYGENCGWFVDEDGRVTLGVRDETDIFSYEHASLREAIDAVPDAMEAEKR